MEFIDIYTRLGESTNQNEEKQLAHEKGLYHKAVHVWIINSKGEVLVQRRSKDKKAYPNMLDISFAGHVSSGESLIDAVFREGKEELGIDIDIESLSYLFSFRVEKEIEKDKYFENEIDNVFLYEKDINVEEYKFLDKEVQEVKYIDFRELEKMWKNGDKELVNSGIGFAALFYELHRRFDNK